MKTKLEITFHNAANTNLIENLAVVVAKHNAGTSNIDLLSLAGFFKTYCAQYGHNAETVLQESALHLSYKDEPFITITEKMIVGEIEESKIKVSETY